MLHVARLLLGATAAASAAASSCPQPHIYLSTTGSDSASGCVETEAVRTPAQAQRLARGSHGTGAAAATVTVWAAPGTYELAAPLELSRADSRTYWTCTPGAARPAVFSGGKLLDAKKAWHPAPSVGAGVLQLDLASALGTGWRSKLGELTPRGWGAPYRWQDCGDYDIEFCPFVGRYGSRFPSALELFTAPSTTAAGGFDAGTAQVLAGFPNHDMLGIAAGAGSPYRPWLNGSTAFAGGFEDDNSGSKRGFRVHASAVPAARWNLSAAGQKGNDIWTHLGQPWKDAHCRLTAVGNTSSKGVTTIYAGAKADPSSGCTGMDQTVDVAPTDGEKFSRFYFYNVLAELDAVSEYFTDRSHGVIYWKPRDAAAASGVVSLLPSVVSIVNASEVTFDGIALLHARANGIDALHSTGVTLRDCVIANVGMLAVNFTNCTDSAISDCSISDTGDGGVWLEGGNRSTLEGGNLTVRGTTFTRCNRWSRTYRPAATLFGVGASFVNNTCQDSPHQCVMIVGNYHVVSDSVFTNNLMESSDSGVIYSESDWTFRGNSILRNNFTGVHSLYYPRDLVECSKHAQKGGWCGDWVKALHFDNQVAGFLVEGNAFENYSYALDANGGGHHTIRDNTFGPCHNQSCTTTLNIHASGNNHLPCKDLCHVHSKHSCAAAAKQISQADFGLSQVPWNSSVWRAHFPELAESIEQSVYCVPVKNTITGNRFTDVECPSFPNELDRASTAEQASWQWQVSNNTNTINCPPPRQQIHAIIVKSDDGSGTAGDGSGTADEDRTTRYVATDSLLEWTGRRIPASGGQGWSIDWEGTRVRATVCNATSVVVVISDRTMGGAKFGVWINTSSGTTHVPNLRVSTFFTKAGSNLTYSLASRSAIKDSCLTYTVQLLIEPSFIQFIHGQSSAIIPAVAELKEKGVNAVFLNATVPDFGTIGCGGHPGVTIHHASFLRAQPIIAAAMGW